MKQELVTHYKEKHPFGVHRLCRQTGLGGNITIRRDRVTCMRCMRILVSREKKEIDKVYAKMEKEGKMVPKRLPLSLSYPFCTCGEQVPLHAPGCKDKSVENAWRAKQESKELLRLIGRR